MWNAYGYIIFVKISCEKAYDIVYLWKFNRHMGHTGFLKNPVGKVFFKIILFILFLVWQRESDGSIIFRLNDKLAEQLC